MTLQPPPVARVSDPGAIVNKTMNRADLTAPAAAPIVGALNDLIRSVAERGVCMSSWHGSLPEPPSLWTRLLRRPPPPVGLASRGPHYEPLPGAADDARLPWYLYWEIAWVMRHGPQLRPGLRLLDAGGASSLFSCYLASLGCEVHTVDLDRTLVHNSALLARTMRWPLYAYTMDLATLEFPDAYFDRAYSICVFEHLDFAVKQAALREIARCLRPDGRLSLTFDYRNPSPYVVGVGPDRRARNRLSTADDLRRNFLSTDGLALVGNSEFIDDGTSWLLHPRQRTPYTFGAMFLTRHGSG